ncbi:MAG: response regulator transcription factor [Bacteroidota bacterium]
MKKPALLFIDDSEMMCQFLVQYFGNRYQVHAFQDGNEAWKWLNEGNFPNLIVLDLKMPTISGAELLNLFKTSTYFHEIPVIILSSIDKSEERVKCLEEGAVDYINKPFNPKELEIRIRFHLQQSTVS